MAFIEPGEELSSQEIADARREFLSNPPPNDALHESSVEAPPEGGGDPQFSEAEQQAAIAELTAPPKPPAGAPEGAPPAPTPPPAPAGTPESFVIGYDQFGNPIQTTQGEAFLAWQVQQALRTEEGVRALAAQSLTALGYSPEQIRAALAAQAGEAPPAPEPEVDPFADLDDTDEVTVGDVKKLLASLQRPAGPDPAVQAQLEQLRAAENERQAFTVRQTTDSACIEILGQPPAPGTPEAQAYQVRVDAIVERGLAYYDPSQWNNPAHIRGVIQRANAELVAADEARFQAYLASKRQSGAQLPPNIAAGAAGEEPMPEPRTLAEARKQAAAIGFFD